MRHLAPKLCATLLPLSFSVQADDARLSECQIQPLFAPQSMAEPPEPGYIGIEADQAIISDDGDTELSGNVVLSQEGRQISAESIEYRASDQRIAAGGGVRFSAADVQVTAASANLEADGKQAQFNNAQFVLGDQARGSAGSVTLARSRPQEREGKSGETRNTQDSRLKDVRYTGCPEGQEAWVFEADEIVLDHDSGIGQARNIKLEFFDVPIFYLPRLSFPFTGERKSGLLFPKLGNSGSSGIDFAWPYYINLAPSYDATVTPRLMTERGLQLSGEFRYLTHNSNGQLDVEYLPQDPRAGSERQLLSVRHDQVDGQVLNSSWKLTGRVYKVSDDDYFRDLGSSLSGTSQPFLRSHVQAGYRNAWLDSELLLSNHRPLDRADAQISPYRQLPRLRTRVQWPLSRGLSVGALGEWANFERRDINLPPGGNRFQLRPWLNWLHEGGYWWTEARAALDYTGYDLNEANGPSSPSRALPILSAKSGLRLTRNNRDSSRQTLTPSIEYRYIPTRDQDDLPLFDTRSPDFAPAWLDRDNRYTGPDRIGDIHGLALMLETRINDPINGRELFALRGGQIVYLNDPEVRLAGETLQRGSSQLVGELQANLARSVRLTSFGEWNPRRNRFERSALGLHYAHAKLGRMSINWRQRRNELEQIELQALRPFGRRWEAAAGWHYSIEDNRNLETTLALEYQGCCWALQFGGRQFVRDSGSTDTALFLQLSLKGLGQLGKGLEFLFEDAERDWTY